MLGLSASVRANRTIRPAIRLSRCAKFEHEYYSTCTCSETIGSPFPNHRRIRRLHSRIIYGSIDERRTEPLVTFELLVQIETSTSGQQCVCGEPPRLSQPKRTVPARIVLFPRESYCSRAKRTVPARSVLFPRELSLYRR